MVASNIPETATVPTSGESTASGRFPSAVREGRNTELGRGTPRTSSSTGRGCAGGLHAGSEVSAREAVHDAGLVRRFHAGEEEAFLEIMRRHSTRIFRVAYNFLHNAADAEEVTQDTFIRAHRALGEFRGESSLATWLHRIAVNLARNRHWYFFRRRRQDSISLETETGAENGGTATFSDCIAATSQTPVQEAVTEEFNALIAGCMERLGAREREILTMRNTLCLPYEEIASALGVSMGTVKSRIARARETLRGLLGESAPEFAGAGEPGDYFEVTRGCARYACSQIPNS